MCVWRVDDIASLNRRGAAGLPTLTAREGKFPNNFSFRENKKVGGADARWLNDISFEILNEKQCLVKMILDN